MGRVGVEVERASRSKVDLDTEGREVLEGRPRFAHRKGEAGKVGR